MMKGVKVTWKSMMLVKTAHLRVNVNKGRFLIQASALVQAYLMTLVNHVPRLGIAPLENILTVPVVLVN
jgi:hypothetical protein